MELVIGCLLITFVGIVFGVVLNPYFWQGIRNSKWFDKNEDIFLTEGYLNDGTYVQ